MKKIFKKIYNPAQGKFLSLVNSRYIIHIVIIFLAVFTIANNISAKETREENFGQKSIIYSLASQINLDAAPLDAEQQTIEEGSLIKNYPSKNNTDKSLSYLDDSTGVKSQPQPREITQEDILNEEVKVPTVQGGSAILKPQISNTRLNLKKRDRPIEYIVKEGDTVSNIAQKFGITTNTILWENKLSTRNYIRPGDKIIILPTSGISHKVKRGDTVTKLAKKYGVEAEKIIEFNKLADASDISIGQKLIIPGGRPRAIARPRTSLRSLKNIFIPPSSPRSTGGRMTWPTAWRVITQYFSWRHSGLDIDGNYKTPIYAADDGVVSLVKYGRRGYGRQIVIDHGNGIKTRYAHASKIFVSPGQRVSRGQTIAMVGTTGHSTGTHLHFEVMVGGRRVNPLRYIR